MSPLLDVVAVGRRFGAVSALSGLSFSLSRGEVLGLLGPNGAGKSTCLQVLAGVLLPSAGRVLVDGIDLQRRPLAAKARIGYLPERSPVYPEMRVDEYLAYAARLHRLPRRAVAGAVERVKARCGLLEVGRRLLGRLSKGYRQRAAVARALVHEPDLVILDEPTDGLDPVQVREMRALIGELAECCGVVVSSHALAEVQAVCSRVLILRDGRALSEAVLAPDAAIDRSYRIRLARPPALSDLRRLAVVAAVESDDGGFYVRLAHGAAAETLAETLVGAGYGLLELSPRRSDLERLFFASIGAEAA